MKQRHPKQLIAVCISMIFMLFAHSTLCFAEHAGVSVCSSSLEQETDSNPAETPQGEEDLSDCCHTHSHSLMAFVGNRAPVNAHSTSFSAGPEKGAPEAPVHEIDYPPQLS